MKQLIELDTEARTATFRFVAKNQIGSRTMGIQYFVPSDAVFQRLCDIPIGSSLNVESSASPKEAPCAASLTDFSLAT